MNKVITISLGGNAYQLEEAAHAALASYLERAGHALAQDPDKDEIIKDLEQAIGQKCSTHLNAHKSVVTATDMEAVLAEMGPVAGASEAGSEAPKEPPPTHKRLYQIRDGAVISGVCKGLAAYFNLDVSLVRVLFIIFTFITQGWGILLYVLMMVFVPVARTPKEMSEASGEMPVTAQELIDRAKEGYEHFKNSGEWRKFRQQVRDEAKSWKHQAKEWKREAKMSKHQAHMEWRRTRAAQWQHSPFWEFMQMVGGILWLLFIGFVIWLAYHHVAPVHQFLDAVWSAFNNLVYTIYQASK